jgi:hypothetical protein
MEHMVTVMEDLVIWIVFLMRVVLAFGSCQIVNFVRKK